MALRDCFHTLRKQISGDDRARIIADVASGTSEVDAIRAVIGEAAGDVLVVAERIKDKGGTVNRLDDTITQIAEMQMRLLDKLHEERLNLNDEVEEVRLETEMIEAVEAIIQNYPAELQERTGRVLGIPGQVDLNNLSQVTDVLSAMLFEPEQRARLEAGIGGVLKGTTPLELAESYGAMQGRKYTAAQQALAHEDRARNLDERLKTVFYGEGRNPTKLYQDFEVMVPWQLKTTGEGDLYIRRHGVNAGMPFRERQSKNDFAITFDPDVLLPDYMFYLLTYLQPKIAARVRGTAQQFVVLDDINAVLTNHFMGQELFQSETGPRLQALHNLTASNLTFADKLGGLAVPSVAVLPEDRALTSFGEITLIGSEDLGDPQQVPLFDADAYAVRTPRAQHSAASVEDVEVMSNEAGEWSLKIEGSRYVGLPDFITEYGRRRPNAEALVDFMLFDNSAKAWFLNERYGEDPAPTVDDVQPGFIWGWQGAIMEFFEGDLSAENLEFEHPRRIKLMKKAAKAVTTAIRHHHIIQTSLGARDRVKESETARAERVWHLTQRSIEIAAIISDDGTLNFSTYERLKRDVKRKGSTQINNVDTKTYLDERIWGHGADAEFKAWIDEKVHGLMGEPRIKIGSKWYPYTLENIVRKMKGKLRGTESNMPSEGLLRAKAAKRIKNLDEARRRALTQIDTPEKVLAARDVSQKMMLEWIDKLKVYWPYNPTSLRAMSDASDAAREATLFWVQNKDRLSDKEAMIRGLERASYVGPFSDEILQQGMDASAATIANPVPYFEAKPQRAVMLSEFRGAVIPLDATPETRATLQKHGIPYIQYTPGDAASKMIALFSLQSRINKAGGRTLFQSDIGFTSGLLNAARVMPREKGTAADMIGTLMKQPGAKKEELDTIDVKAWAEAKGYITREELVAFIENNGVQVKETFYGAQLIEPDPNQYQFDRAPDAAYEELEDFEFDTPYDQFAEAIWDVMSDRNDPFAPRFRVWHDEDAGNVRVQELETGKELEIDDPINQQDTASASRAITKYLTEEQRIPGSLGFTKWHMYELEGVKENSREIVLHLPEIVPVTYAKDNLNPISYRMMNPGASVAQQEGQDAQFWFIQAPEQTFQILKSKYPTMQSAMDYIMEEKQPGADLRYNIKTHGFDEVLNAMVWLRTTDRAGPNGERILFIEEMQSALHQAGAKLGYRGNPEQIKAAHALLDATRPGAVAAVTALDSLGYDSDMLALEAIVEDENWAETYDVTDPGQIAALNEYRDAALVVNQTDVSRGPLDFPFKGNAWIELGMKRVIRLAAEGGYDQIAWTTGEQQNDRWGSAMVYDKIEWDPRSEHLIAWNAEGERQISEPVKFSDLHEWIGAERVLEIQKQMQEAKDRYDIVPAQSVLEEDDQFIGSAIAIERQWFVEGRGFVLVDENGEIVRESSGDYVMAEHRSTAHELAEELAYKDNLPTLTGQDFAVGGKFLTNLYDKVLVNVMNKAARKVDKKAKASRKSITMQGGSMPHLMTVEGDGETFYISGVPPELPTDAPRRQLSPRFKTMKQADEWRDARVMGFAHQQHGMDVTPEMVTQAMRGQTLFQGRKRGSIVFDENRRAIIRLTKSRNLSTFLHESGHMYLEMMADLAEEAVGPRQVIDDFQKILEYLGVNRREEITREHHELWARSFEAYLREGKAPSAELRGIFSEFAAWLTNIYRLVSQLLTQDETLSADIRGVMDRMIATDEAIADAENQQGFTAIYSSAEQMGVSEEVFAVYRQHIAQAHQDAVDQELRKVLAAMNRAAKQWYKDERKKVEADVRAKIYGMRVYQALAMLQRGEHLDGTIPPRRFKLDRDDLIQRYGKEFIKKLPKPWVYARKGGIDLDVAAGIFGYTSGDELIQDMMRAPNMEALIAAETDSNMEAAFPDPIVDGTLARDAIVAVHNDRRAQILGAELRALRRQMREDQKIVSATKREAARFDRQKRAANAGMLPNRGELAIIKKLAKDEIDAMRIRDVNPNRYRMAEQKAGRKAFEAAAKNDYETAYLEKLAQIHNHELFRAATRAKEESARTQEYLKKFEKTSMQRRLGKSGMLDKILAVIEGIDFRKVSLVQVDRDKAMAEMIQAVEDGRLVVPPDTFAKLVNVGTNWRDLSVTEFRDMRDLVRQLHHQAKTLAEGVVNGEKVLLQDAANDVIDSILENNKFVPAGVSSPDLSEKGKRSLQQGVMSWLRASSIARVLDQSGFGALTKRIIVPIRRAYAERLIPGLKKAQKDVSDIYLKHYTTAEIGNLHKRVWVEAMGENLSKADMLSIALNWGNAGNRAALLGGVKRDGSAAYTEQGIQAVLSMMDENDVAFMNDIWDYLDSYWPELSAAEQRRRGIAPQKVEAMPFTFTGKDGQELTAKGGYYPLVYDRRHSERIKQAELEDIYKKMGNGVFITAQTRAGSTFERVQNHGMVVRLGLHTVDLHLREIVRDIAIGDEVNFIKRLLNDKEVRAAFNNTGNDMALEALNLWLTDAAVGELPAEGVVEKGTALLRTGFVKAKLGWNLMTTLLQFTGIFQTIAVIGTQAYARGFGKFLQNPVKMYKFVMDQSAFMHTRYIDSTAFDKDVLDAQAHLNSFFGPAPTRAKVWTKTASATFFWPIAKAQSIVDVTTWLGAYWKGRNVKNLNDADAIIYADVQVENAQTSGFYSDRSGLERGTLGSRKNRQSQFIRIWTTLISYMLAKSNIAYEKGVALKRKPTLKGAVFFATDLLLLYTMEGIAAALIYDQLPDEDDDEEWGWWVAKATLDSAVSGIPFVREIPAAKFGGGNTAIGSLGDDIYSLGQQIAQGEIDEALLKNLNNVGGTLFHYPSSQTNRLLDAYWAEDDPEFYEWFTGVRGE